MAFKKNDRVKFMNKNEEIHGVVIKGGAVASIVEDMAQRSYKVPQHYLQSSNRPLTPELQSYLGRAAPKFAKGDRVMFTDNGEVIHGTVEKAGTTMTVRQDGGVVQWKIGQAALKPSDAPLKKDPPHEMDRWGLTGYKAYDRMSEETVAFEAYVTLDGKKVLFAKNSGTGGCNMYHPVAGTGRDTLLVQFENTARDWLIAMGYPEDKVFEAADSWIDWKVNKAPYNVTAQEDVEATLSQFAEWDAASAPKI